jgi:hypothetical protein
MFKKNKKIKFYSDKVEFEILKPTPTSKVMPGWYRKMSGASEGIPTIKKCIPVVDALTAGYVIPLPFDLTWSEAQKDFLTNGRFQINSNHHPVQTDKIPVPEEYDPQPHKWINSWYIKTPPGYSTLFIHPLNRLDLPFYSISGIVDTDRHPLVVNFPFFWKKDFRGTVPAGTPIIQAIPFKREDWDSEVHDTGKSHSYPRQFEVEMPPFAWYKRLWWVRKRYS